MIETFTALAFAHVLADFVFQGKAMAEGKGQRSGAGLGYLAAHGAIVAALSALVLAGADARPVALLALAHLATDFAKGFAPRGLAAFLADQAVHFVTLAALSAAFPGLWAQSLWAGQGWLPGTMALLAGLVVTTRAGGFAVGLLMVPYAAAIPPEGLPRGGQMIGLLERGLIFLLVLAGEPGGIGFLIAAKSILRFEAVQPGGANPKSEYVIIGTLASFGWALAAGYATLALMRALPGLGILPPAP